jgi:cold shock CspA family protein
MSQRKENEQLSSRIRGQLVHWNDVRGFGFLRASDGSETFAHATQFADGHDEPCKGDWYEYCVGPSPKSQRDEAKLITPLSPREVEEERAWASQHEPVGPESVSY